MPHQPAATVGDRSDVITEVLETSGGADTLERLVPLVYEELRRMAHWQLRRERHHHTLNTTALVHEAYLRLVDQTRISEKGRTYFFGAAARAMRQVLVDYARRRNALKRGGDRVRVTLQEDRLALDQLATDLIDLDDALKELSALNPRHVRVVECRYFAGMSVTETAEVLDIAPRTVKRDWMLAKAWLYEALRGQDAP